MILFKDEEFTAHSGDVLKWKIECDTLCNEDIECIAKIIARRYNFSRCYGVPRGGNRIARAILQHGRVSEHCCNVLIVDDVYTTGASMTEARERVLHSTPPGNEVCILGCVIFARRKISVRDRWISALWNLGEGFYS